MGTASGLLSPEPDSARGHLSVRRDLQPAFPDLAIKQIRHSPCGCSAAPRPGPPARPPRARLLAAPPPSTPSRFCAPRSPPSLPLPASGGGRGCGSRPREARCSASGSGCSLPAQTPPGYVRWQDLGEAATRCRVFSRLGPAAIVCRSPAAPSLSSQSPRRCRGTVREPRIASPQTRHARALPPSYSSRTHTHGFLGGCLRPGDRGEREVRQGKRVAGRRGGEPQRWRLVSLQGMDVRLGVRAATPTACLTVALTPTRSIAHTRHNPDPNPSLAAT